MLKNIDLDAVSLLKELCKYLVMRFYMTNDPVLKEFRNGTALVLSENMKNIG